MRLNCSEHSNALIWMLRTAFLFSSLEVKFFSLIRPFNAKINQAN